MQKSIVWIEATGVNASGVKVRVSGHEVIHDGPKAAGIVFG
jgi:hypothetical protein